MTGEELYYISKALYERDCLEVIKGNLLGHVGPVDISYNLSRFSFCCLNETKSDSIKRLVEGIVNVYGFNIIDYWVIVDKNLGEDFLVNQITYKHVFKYEY